MSDTEFTDIVGNDVFDIRDVIERFEVLDGIKDTAEFSNEEKIELAAIDAFLNAVAGHGGDEQWNGVWYPVTFIRESYFKDYAKELAEDIGAINKNANWPNNHIHWEDAAEELKQDYSSVEIDGTTFWYR